MRGRTKGGKALRAGPIWARDLVPIPARPTAAESEHFTSVAISGCEPIRRTRGPHVDLRGYTQPDMCVAAKTLKLSG